MSAREPNLRSLGRRRWAIAEGYIPGWGNGPKPQFESHETVCILNTGASDANVTLHIFFADRAPAGPYHLRVPARRTLHQRFNELDDPEPIPKDTGYACLIESDVPVVCQHTRLDSRQSANALISTIAYTSDD